MEEREAFGEKLSAKTSIQHDVARSRYEIEQCRLLVLAAADNFEELAGVPLGESSFSTPAVSSGIMYLRTAKRLYSLGG